MPWVMSVATRRRWKEFSLGVAMTGAIVLLIGVAGASMFGTADLEAAMARLPASQNIGTAIVDLFAFEIDVVSALSSPAGRAAAGRDIAARNAAASAGRLRDAATWRSFRARPVGGEVGVRLAEICPSLDPPDPTRCIADAHRALDSMWQGRARWRNRFGVLGVMGLLALMAAGLVRGFLAFGARRAAA